MPANIITSAQGRTALIFTLYGAMLAGWMELSWEPQSGWLPAVCTRLAQHAVVTSELSVLYRESGETFQLTFDPRQVADGRLAQNPLVRPAFLAIVSLENLVQALAHSQTETPDGYHRTSHCRRP